VAGVLYFNGTGSVYVCIGKSKDDEAPVPRCNVDPRFIIPSIRQRRLRGANFHDQFYYGRTAFVLTTDIKYSI